MGQSSRDFRRLDVWRKAHELTLDVYCKTQSFPRSEMYGLTSQMRRAAYSTPSNIAEGCGRGTEAELGRFMRIALGSANELAYFVILACDLEYLTPADRDRLANAADQISRMLNAYIAKLHSGDDPANG